MSKWIPLRRARCVATSIAVTFRTKIPSVSALKRSIENEELTSAASSALQFPILTRCLLGVKSTWPLVKGAISKKATTCSVDSRTYVGGASRSGSQSGFVVSAGDIGRNVDVIVQKGQDESVSWCGSVDRSWILGGSSAINTRGASSDWDDEKEMVLVILMV